MNERLDMPYWVKVFLLICLFKSEFDDENVEQIFQRSKETTKFCLSFNTVVNFLNCKNKFFKNGYNIPLHYENYDFNKHSVDEAEKCISCWCNEARTPIWNGKTGFLWMIIGLRIISSLHNELKKHRMTYLLT